jgi:hypothetical protein
MEIQEENKTIQLIKKITITLIALFLIFLIVSYFVPGYKILNIIEGKIISQKLDDNLSITLKDKQIIFNPITYTELLNIYDNNQVHELKVCLHGNLNNNIYYLNKIEYPIIISQDIFSVTSKPCSKETLISLHSHPENNCIPSTQDIKSQETNTISAIMCSKKRFNFYD